MNTKQINWFRNRKSQKRAETAIGSDGKRHRNQSQSLNQNRLSECESESRRAHQFNSIRHQAYIRVQNFHSQHTNYTITHNYTSAALPLALSLASAFTLAPALLCLLKRK